MNKHQYLSVYLRNTDCTNSVILRADARIDKSSVMCVFCVQYNVWNNFFFFFYPIQIDDIRTQ